MADTLFNAKAPGVMHLLMNDFMIEKEDAAAILGNIGEECGGFTKMQEEHPTVSGSRGGYGWCQWTGPRRVTFEEYCSRSKLDPASDRANYGFMFTELKASEAGALTKTKAAVGLQNKVIAFEQAYLRAGTPHYSDRVNWANKALAVFNASAHVDALPSTAPYNPVLPGQSTKENDMPTGNPTPPTVTVATQSPMASTTNWAQVASFATLVFAWFKVPIPSEITKDLVLGIPAAMNAFTFIRRTWFTKTVTTTAVKT